MIDLYFSYGKAYVWNAEDWETLRKDHRIVGELIGTVAPFPRNSAFQGFPMLLMSEETMLLVEEGICRLVAIKALNHPPTGEIVELSKETEERIYSEQMECLKGKRVEQIESKIDLIIAGKKKKMNSQGKSPDMSREKMIEDQVKKIQPPSASNVLVQIPTEYPWPSEISVVNVDQLEPAVETTIGKLKYAVFKDLWHRGHYITAGTKFGGDFLIYPGDPVKFHATYIIKCIESESKALRLSAVVGFGRLGVSVNKLTVFAYTDSGKNICYQTVQWHETLY